MLFVYCHLLISLMILQQYGFVESSVDYSSPGWRNLPYKKNSWYLRKYELSEGSTSTTMIHLHNTNILRSLRCGGEENGINENTSEEWDEDESPFSDAETPTLDGNDNFPTSKATPENVNMNISDELLEGEHSRDTEQTEDGVKENDMSHVKIDKNKKEEDEDDEKLKEEFQLFLQNHNVQLEQKANKLRKLFLRWAKENCRDENNVKEIHELSLLRADEYINDVLEFKNEQMEQILLSKMKSKVKKNKKQAPQPNKLLHIIAPKVPAIRQSPDFLLRIRTARPNEDSGLAAFSIALIAGVTHFLDQILLSMTNEHSPTKSKNKDLSEEIIGDRRFEQLVECVLCGVDVRKRMKEFQDLKLTSRQEECSSNSEISKHPATFGLSYIEDEVILSSDHESVKSDSEGHELKINENAQLNEGLTVCEAAQAAWGLSILGAHRLESIGGKNPIHILIALSLRSREILLARLNLLREFDGRERNADDVKFEGTTTREIEKEKINQHAQFNISKQSLLKDIVSSVWSFACVKECTALRNDYLFDACCTILFQTEEKLWNSRVKDMEEKLGVSSESQIKEEDILDRLAMAEESQSDDEHVVDEHHDDISDHDSAPTLSENDEIPSGGNDVHISRKSSKMADNENMETNDDNKEQPRGDKTMLENLSPKDLIKVMWSLSIHGFSPENEVGASSHFSHSKFESFRKILKEKWIHLLEENLSIAIHSQKSQPTLIQTESNENKNMNSLVDDLPEDEFDISTDEVSHIEVIGAAKLIASEIVEKEKLDVPTKCDSTSSFEDAANHAGETRSQAENSNAPKGKGHESPGMSMEKMTLHIESSEEGPIEVMDATAILAAEAESTSKTITPQMEKTLLNIDTLEEGPIEVMDAAAILAAEAASTGEKKQLPTTENEKNHKSLDEKTDSGVRQNDIKVLPNDATSKDSDLRVNKNAPLHTREPIFSLQDLCTLAWSLTELDLMSLDAYNLILKTLEVSGFENLKDLQTDHLVNLLWALSKFSDEDLSFLDACDVNETLLLIFSKSTADILWERLQSLENITEMPLEPTELSRLLWSMASLSSHLRLRNRDDSIFQDYFSKLAFFAVEFAGDNISFFSSEDLARITWAYAACVTNHLGGSSPLHLAKPFGMMLSTMESSLIRWETGQLRIQKNNDRYVKKIKESIRYTPIFGRSRFSPLSLLNLNLFVDSEEDEEKNHLESSLSSLPLLGDLTIDPATLCKLAFEMSCIASYDENMTHLNKTFLRIAIRLLVAKQGQLLKECNHRDLVRLCFVCANILGRKGIEVNNEDRDFILRSFPRRVVQVLNDSVSLESESILNRLHYNDLALLLWSLGDLGVKAASFDENNQQAYRKMKLVASLPTLEKKQLEMLSPNLTFKLFHGIHSIGELRQSMSLLQTLCTDLGSKIKHLKPPELCDLAQTIGKLRRELKDLRMNRKELDSKLDNNNLSFAGDKDKILTSSKHEESRDEDRTASEKITKVVTDIRQRYDASVDDLFDSCNRMLLLIADTAQNILSKFKAKEIHCLLQIFTMMPFQVDQFVDEVECEIRLRLDEDESPPSMYSADNEKGVHDSVRNTAKLALETSDSMSSLLASKRPSDGLLKTGMKTLLELASISKEKKEESDGDLLDWGETENKLEQTVIAASSVKNKLDRLSKESGTNLNSIFLNLEKGVSIDLGRCLELIDGYRRYNFDSGCRSNRFDDSRRRVVPNRILGSIFQ